MKKIMLIDGYSLANRAFYALPMLTTSAGLHTNAVYGFAMMLLRLIEEERPDYLAVAFDVAKPTFRHREFADYKAGRRETPGELREQFPVLQQMLEVFRVPVIAEPGFEADDIIGTMAERAEAAGLAVLVVTGDRDAFQLVSPAVQVLYTRRGITEVDRVDEDYLRQRYNLAPGQIPDLKGLMGDSSDNIPGVPGVGEKTALRLLRQFGSIESLLTHLEEISRPKERELIATHAEQARQSKKLATIERNVPVAVDLEQCRRQEPDWEELSRIFTELGFKTLLARLAQKREGEPVLEKAEPEPEPPVQITAAGELRAAMWPAGDQPLYCQLVGAAGNAGGGAAGLCWLDPEGKCRYLPFTGEIPPAVLDHLADPAGSKVCHDAKSQMHLLAGRAADLNGVVFDTMVAAYLVNPALGRTEPRDLAAAYLGETPAAPGETKDPAALSAPFSVAEAARAAALRLQVMPRLREVLADHLHADGLWELFEQVELPLTEVLFEMEREGIAVDLPFLRELGDELGRDLAAIEAEICELAGEQFNLNSPRQLAAVLFERLGLPAKKRTKTGYSTDAGVLEELAAEHPVVAKILDYRQMSKLKSTYVDALQTLADPASGRIHTTFNQAATATGRLSSTEPNLQNIPVRTEIGRRIRRAFVPGDQDRLLLAADYSQIELRVLAHFSNDPNFTAAFREGDDIHRRTAAEVFGLPEEAVTPTLRNRAKAVNFGIIYGQTGYGLARSIGVGVGEADEYIQRYFQRYQGIKSYLDRVIAEAHARKFVTTLLGRRRYLPDLASQNRVMRSYAERTARNTPIQGTAADIIKVAMVRTYRRLQKEAMKAKLILQVHDELIFTVPRGEISALAALVRTEMEQAVELSVPLVVEVKTGENWADMKKVEATA